MLTFAWLTSRMDLAQTAIPTNDSAGFSVIPSGKTAASGQQTFPRALFATVAASAASEHVTSMNPLRNLPHSKLLGASMPAVLLVALLSAAIGATIVIVVNKPNATPPMKAEAGQLSEGTRVALQHLNQPVQLRFYAMFDSKTVSPELKEYAARAERLIREYELESAGRIQVERFSSTADPDAVHSASRDGVQPFNLQSGDACFFGIAVAQDDRRETLPRLSPEWESALEADLTRAIVRVSTPAPATSTAAESGIDPQVRAAAVEQVQRTIPQPADVSLDDGRKRLREMAFEEFKSAASEMQQAVQQAQQRLAAAQSSGSETDRHAAFQELQEAQHRQAEKLKEIATRSQAQIEAWEKLKEKAP